MYGRTRLSLHTISLALLLAVPARAQHPGCRFICAPTLRLSPGVLRSHLVERPEVRSLSTGRVSRLPSKSNLEMVLFLSAPTAVPRTSLFTSLQWLPDARASTNPFTEYTAAELDEKVRSNLPSVSLGARFDVLTPEQTHGWLALDPYLADLFSRAARPGDESDYTHKLDVGATASVNLFARLPAHVWLHDVSAYVTLDDVLTGLPRAGDEVPRGSRVFLDDARAVSLIVGVSAPLAPLAPKGK